MKTPSHSCERYFKAVYPHRPRDTDNITDYITNAHTANEHPELPEKLNTESTLCPAESLLAMVTQESH